MALKERTPTQLKRRVALEITEAGLVFAISEQPDGGEVNLRFRNVSWSQGVSELNNESAQRELATAIANLVAEERLAGTTIDCALGGDFCITRVLAGLTDKVQRELRSLEKRISLYLSLGSGPKTYTQSLRSIDNKRSQAWMTVANAQSLGMIYQALRDAGLKVSRFEHSLVALARAVGHLGYDAESPVMIIEMTSRGVDLGISYQGRLLLDYRPGGTASKQHLAETVMLHLDRIQRHCNRNFQLTGGHITKVYLCGDASEIGPIQDQFAASSVLSPEVLNPKEMFPQWKSESLSADQSWLMPALGSLVAAENRQLDQHSPNLMDPIRLQQREPLTPLLMRHGWPVALALAASLVIWMASWWAHRGTSQLEARAAQAEEVEISIQQKQLELGVSDAKIRYLNNIGSNIAKPMWHELLAEVSGCLPEGVWLDSMKVEKTGAIFISGPSYSEDGVYEFVNALKEVRALSNIALEATRPTRLNNGAATLFEIKAQINGSTIHN